MKTFKYMCLSFLQNLRKQNTYLRKKSRSVSTIPRKPSVLCLYSSSLFFVRCLTSGSIQGGMQIRYLFWCSLGLATLGLKSIWRQFLRPCASHLTSIRLYTSRSTLTKWSWVPSKLWKSKFHPFISYSDLPNEQMLKVHVIHCCFRSLWYRGR